MNTTIPTPPEANLETQAEKKRRVFNILAILGFLATVVLIAWLSIQVVRVLPGAFTSLANLAETLSGRSERTITITGPAGEVAAGSEVTLSWEAAPVPGSYTFSYECVDGVAIEIRKNDTVREVRCDTTYSLDDATTIHFLVTSRELDSASVPYTVTFLRKNDTMSRLTGEGQFTVRRDSAVATPAPETSTETTPREVVMSPTPTGAPTPTTPTAPPTTAPATGNTYTYRYLPESNPNGTIDLAVRLIAVGTIRGTNFTEHTTLQSGRENALRFEVKNHGTKTSDTWSYRVSLPDGSTYVADEQKPLKPNERSTITITFNTPYEVTGLVRTSVTVNASGDRTSINDRFVETLRATR
jgi:hypothetical protein